MLRRYGYITARPITMAPSAGAIVGRQLAAQAAAAQQAALAPPTVTTFGGPCLLGGMAIVGGGSWLTAKKGLHKDPDTALMIGAGAVLGYAALLYVLNQVTPLPNWLIA